jgi:bacterioferritin-associated ferredoxin
LNLLQFYNWGETALAVIDIESYIQLRMFVCCCMGVTDRAIRRAIDQGAETVEAVAACTGAGTRCGSCRPEIHGMLRTSAGCPGEGEAGLAACPAPRRLPFFAGADGGGGAAAPPSAA